MNLPIVIAASALGALFVWLTGDLLPATMVSGFDGAGMPRGRTSRESYLTLMILVVAGLPVFMALVTKLAGSFGLVNVPHRDYWMAPERRAESMKFLDERMAWLAVGMAVFLCFVHWLVIRAHRVDPPHLDPVWMWAGLAVFLAWTAAWTGTLFRRFHSPR